MILWQARCRLQLWSEYQAIASVSVDVIRRHGYSRSAAFQVALRVGPELRSHAGQQLKDELRTFIEQESALLQADARLLCSSETLESAFGQVKSFCGDHQSGGFTSQLLSLGALVGRLDRQSIYDALVSVPWKHVTHWVETHLGQTYQSKRRLAYQTSTNESATKGA